jgi:hypothetical protein
MNSKLEQSLIRDGDGVEQTFVSSDELRLLDERFKGRRPEPPLLPPAVWINPPNPLPKAIEEKTDLTGSPQSHDLDPDKGSATPEHSADTAATSHSPPPALH